MLLTIFYRNSPDRFDWQLERQPAHGLFARVYRTDRCETALASASSLSYRQCFIEPRSTDCDTSVLYIIVRLTQPHPQRTVAENNENLIGREFTIEHQHSNARLWPNQTIALFSFKNLLTKLSSGCNNVCE